MLEFLLPTVTVYCLPVVQEFLDDGFGDVRALTTAHNGGDFVLEELFHIFHGTISANMKYKTC